MTNFLSKSDYSSDLQKIQFDIQLMLTEQRAQRVDLARVIQLVRKCIAESDDKPLETYDQLYPEEEQAVDVSSSTGDN